MAKDDQAFSFFNISIFQGRIFLKNEIFIYFSSSRWRKWFLTKDHEMIHFEIYIDFFFKKGTIFFDEFLLNAACTSKKKNENFMIN